MDNKKAMNNGKALVIVFRGGNTYWWKPWDGRQHTDVDGFNFKNSLFNCIKTLARRGDQIGLMVVDASEDVYNLNSSYRPSDVKVSVLVDSISNYMVVDVESVPSKFTRKLINVFGYNEVETLKQVEFDFSNVDHFLLWVGIKMEDVFQFVDQVILEEKWEVLSNG